MRHNMALLAAIVLGFIGLVAALLFPLAAYAEPVAEAPPSAAEVTDRNRSLDHIVRRLLRGDGSDGPRTLVLLVDPGPALVTAGFTGALEKGLSGLRDDPVNVGVGVVGREPLLALPPGRDRAAVLATVKEALASPRNEIRDVLAAVRKAAARIKGRAGTREIALLSLENGDGESDLEAAAASLARSGVVVHCVGRGAFLADSYWIRYSSVDRPRKLTMRGQDGPYDDLPWGWILQRAPANECVSSGFGLFGLSRLVHATGGRYFLYYPPSNTLSACGGTASSCRLCSHDHGDCGNRYQHHKLRDLAPLIGSRLEARKTLARDPVFVAVLKVWGKAAGAGLISSRPPLKPGPGLLREERRRTASPRAFMDSTSFGSVGRRAGKLADICARLAKEIEEALAYADPSRTSKRSIAIAETTRAQLLVTRLNLKLLQAFCERAPAWLSRPEEGLVAPEIPLFDSRRFDYRSITFMTQCFCHGTKATMRLEIPGLAEAEAERTAAFAAVDGLLARYDGTPFGRAARVMGVAIYFLSAPGIKGNVHRRIPGTESDETTTGGSDRPARGGTGGSSGGGATTGGD